MKGNLKSVEKNVLCTTKNKLTERLLQHFVPIYLVYFSMFVVSFFLLFFVIPCLFIPQ